MLEGYTSLGFLAGQTQTTTLGLLVTGVTYRHPGLLAKTVASLDAECEKRWTVPSPLPLGVFRPRWRLGVAAARPTLRPVIYGCKRRVLRLVTGTVTLPPLRRSGNYRL